MAKPVYVFDSSSFINLIKEYPPNISYFENLWKKIDQLVKEGRLVSCREVDKEIQDPEFDAWRKKNKQIFGVQHEHFDLVKEILVKYPQLDEEKDTAAHADPFLVAQALHNLRTQKEQGKDWRPYLIVTDEAKKRRSPKKLPFVASQYGIECLSLLEFLEREDWKKR